MIDIFEPETHLASALTQLDPTSKWYWPINDKDYTDICQVYKISEIFDACSIEYLDVNVCLKNNYPMFMRFDNHQITYMVGLSNQKCTIGLDKTD